MNYYIDSETQKFKFPNYNKDKNNYLVNIKDLTNYKECYFVGYDKEYKRKFSFDDFEQIFTYPEIEVECFEDFLKNLNKKYFDVEIGKEGSLNLFLEFGDFLDESENWGEPIIFNKPDAIKSVKSGYLEIAPDIITKEDYLTLLSIPELILLCETHDIKPFKTKLALIKHLSKENIDINVVFVNPTKRLKIYFLQIIELYISEFKKNADRFHPLYFEAIFDEVSSISDNLIVNALLKKELESKYWEDRLEKKCY